MIDETKLERLSENYLAALRVYFEKGAQAGSQAAQHLGDEAVTLGLGTLDLAKLHDRAVGSLVVSGCSTRTQAEITNQATNFFSSVLVPIEKTHRLARQAGAQLDKLNASLVLRTQEVATSRRNLEQDVTLRESAETALESSHLESARLVEESQQLQNRLQEMAHMILTAQEDERTTMCRTLHDDIAQTLLGLQVRLLALKKEAALDNEDFKKEIAITQTLVEESVQTIRRFARELGIPHEN